jgi:polyhydroxyalkanoate synthase subunit PhaE
MAPSADDEVPRIAALYGSVHAFVFKNQNVETCHCRAGGRRTLFLISQGKTMNQEQQKKNDLGSLWAEWMKSANDFWQSAAKPWQFMSASGMYASTADDAKSQMESYWEKSLDAWKTMFSGFCDSEIINCFKSPDAFAEISSSFVHALLDGGVRFQEWMNYFGRLQGGNGFNVAGGQRELFQAWMEFHEKEIQPLLKIPQVGLTRFYQEKANQLLDKMNTYQAAIIEFQYLLSLPIEQSLRTMQEQLAGSKAENLLGNLNSYYTKWIKTLEGQYMELFRSPEWHQSLNRLIDGAASFRASRNEILTDFIQFLPIPTNKDMDDVYKELYHLKKTIKQMAKKLKDLEPQAQYEQRGMLA